MQIATKNKVIEVKDLKFHVRPEVFTDINEAFTWAEANGIPVETKNPVQAYTLNCYTFMLRIVKWDGVKLDTGKKAPCSMDNKQALFGQNPELLTDVITKWAENEEVSEGNSETS